jgi:nitrate/TMAO reductase-like tetraheme cytochrome c subunit
MPAPRLDWTRHPVGLLGAMIATISAVLILSLFLAGLAGYEGGPYIGIVAYSVFPGLFVVGLLMIPIGLWLERRRLVKLAASGGIEPPLWHIDLNDPKTRRRVIGFVALTVVNLLIIGIASYKGLEVMDSPEFCGSCHAVMDPEYTAYKASPHARVRCVECHIGRGASWFVKSKLSGSWQLISVNLNLYPRPVPTPVHNLRPARETCEECHWPDKFTGDKFLVRSHYDEDEQSTEKKSVVILKVGGGTPERGQGIHWHVMPGVEIRYQADDKRQEISVVEVKRPGGAARTYAKKGAKATGDSWRTMDCIDCHNRPTHQFKPAETVVDHAIEVGRIDRSLPFVRREAMKAVKAQYASHDAARAGIRDALKGFYSTQYPEVAKEKGATIDRAIDALIEGYTTHVWPQMKIAWGTYPSFLGHDQAPGCFRCHDEEHVTADGKAISQDCGLCHSLLADREADPAILKQLK